MFILHSILHYKKFTSTQEAQHARKVGISKLMFLALFS